MTFVWSSLLMASLVTASPTTQRYACEGAVESRVAWSDDGRFLAFGGLHQGCVVDTQTHAVHPLASGEFVGWQPGTHRFLLTRRDTKASWIPASLSLLDADALGTDDAEVQTSHEVHPAVSYNHAYTSDEALLLLDGVMGHTKVLRADSLESIALPTLPMACHVSIGAGYWQPGTHTLLTIAFCYDSAPYQLVRIIDVDAAKVVFSTPLARSYRWSMEPHAAQPWSPDGSRFFLPCPEGVCFYAPDGTLKTRASVPQDPHGWKGSWNETGNLLALQGTWDSMVVDADRGAVQVQLDFRSSGDPAIFSGNGWLDDDQVLMSRAPKLSADTDFQFTRWIYDVRRQGAVRELGASRSMVTDMSPDGQYISEAGGVHGRIIRVADGAVIAEDAYRSYGQSWSPGGERVAFGGKDGATIIGIP